MVYLGRAVMLLVVKAHRDLVLPIIVPHLVRPNQTTHLVVQTIIHHLVKAIRNNSQGLFGSGTGNAFGSNTGGSTFGSNNTGFGAGGNAFGQQGNTGFGANKPVTTGFGSSTSGGLFGQQSQQQQPGATGGLFGQNQQQQQNAGGGLFGAKPAGGSVFGQSNTNASGGGLFGGQQNTPTTGGGYLGQNLPLRVGYLVVNNQDKHNKEEGCLVNKINKIHREVDCLETSLLVQPRQMVVGCLVINRQQGRIVWWSTTTNPATTTTATISIRGGLFGAKPGTTASLGGGLFGGQQQTSNVGGGLFGGGAASTGGLFGAKTNANATSNSTSTGGLFGGATTVQQQPQQAQQALASINSQNPYGNNPLFQSITGTSSQQQQQQQQQQQTNNLPQFSLVKSAAPIKKAVTLGSTSQKVTPLFKVSSLPTKPRQNW